MPTDSTRLALVIAAILLLIPGAPSSSHLVFLVTIAVLLAVSTRRTLRRTTIVALLLGMIVIRVALNDTTGSDVLIVTEAAIKRVLAGFSPYAVGYRESTPPGAPFPYGPVALLWYIPLRDISEVMELGAAIVVALVLALRGRLVGLVVFVIAQFGGYFGSYVYLAAVAPILCWRIDDWLHRGLPEVARAYADAHGISLRVTRPTRAPSA